MKDSSTAPALLSPETQAEALIRHYARVTNLFIAGRTFFIAGDPADASQATLCGSLTEMLTRFGARVVTSRDTVTCRDTARQAVVPREPAHTHLAEDVDVLLYIGGAYPVIPADRSGPLVVAPAPGTAIPDPDGRMPGSQASIPRPGIRQQGPLILLDPPPMPDWRDRPDQRITKKPDD